MKPIVLLISLLVTALTFADVTFADVTLVYELQTSLRSPQASSFNEDESVLYLGDRGGSLAALTRADGTILFEKKIHNRGINTLSYFGGKVYSGSDDKSLIQTNASSGEVEKTLALKDRVVFVKAENQTITTIEKSGEISLLDTPLSNIRLQYQTSSQYINAANTFGDYFLGERDGTLRVILPDGNQSFELNPHQSAITQIEVSGDSVLTIGRDNRFILNSLQARTSTLLEEMNSPILSMAMDTSKRFVFVATRDGLVKVYDLLKKKIHLTMENFDSSIVNLIVAEEAKQLCVLTKSGLLQVWDIKDVYRNSGEEQQLHNAVAAGDVATVEALILGGADVDPLNKMAQTPLVSALTSSLDNNIVHNIAKILIDAGAKLYKYDLKGRNAFLLAKKNHLIGKTKDLIIKTYVQRNLELHLAAEANDIVGVEKALLNGADASSYDINDKFPLYYAATNGSDDISSMLIEHESFRYSAKNSEGYQINGQLTLSNYPQISFWIKTYILEQRQRAAQLMGSNGPLADIQSVLSSRHFTLESFDIVDSIEYSVMFNVAVTGRVDYLKAALNSGLPYEHFEEAQSILPRLSSLSQLELLVNEYEADIDKNRGSTYFNLLHRATLAGDLAMVKTLVEKYGYDPKLKSTQEGSSSVGIAFSNGHSAILEFFKQKGFWSVNAPIDSQGNLPLHLAVRGKDMNLIRFLLQNGAEVNKKNNQGETVAFYINENTTQEILNFLVQSGLRFNVKNRDGVTPIIKAVDENNLRTFKFLHRLNTDLGGKGDKDGLSYIHKIIRDGKTKFFKEVLTKLTTLTGPHYYHEHGTSMINLNLLQYASYIDQIDFLITNSSIPVNIWYVDEEKRKLNVFAAAGGHLGLLKWFQLQGMNFWVKDAKGRLPQDHARGSFKTFLIKEYNEGIKTYQRVANANSSDRNEIITNHLRNFNFIYNGSLNQILSNPHGRLTFSLFDKRYKASRKYILSSLMSDKFRAEYFYIVNDSVDDAWIEQNKKRLAYKDNLDFDFALRLINVVSSMEQFPLNHLGDSVHENFFTRVKAIQPMDRETFQQIVLPAMSKLMVMGHDIFYGLGGWDALVYKIKEYCCGLGRLNDEDTLLIVAEYLTFIGKYAALEQFQKPSEFRKLFKRASDVTTNRSEYNQLLIELLEQAANEKFNFLDNARDFDLFTRVLFESPFREKRELFFQASLNHLIPAGELLWNGKGFAKGDLVYIATLAYLKKDITLSQFDRIISIYPRSSSQFKKMISGQTSSHFKASTDTVANYGENPLFLAARFGDKALADKLLRLGIDKNAKRRDGKTADKVAKAYGDNSLARFIRRWKP